GRYGLGRGEDQAGGCAGGKGRSPGGGPRRSRYLFRRTRRTDGAEGTARPRHEPRPARPERGGLSHACRDRCALSGLGRGVRRRAEPQRARLPLTDLPFPSGADPEAAVREALAAAEPAAAGRLGVAVSGGGDSTALLLLLHRV